MSGPRLVLTTVADHATADRIAHSLVEERLAACVNIVPGLRSIYRWEGEVEASDEVLLLIKTRTERVDTVRERLHELHPYTLPEFLVLPVEGGSEAYLAWITSSVG